MDEDENNEALKEKLELIKEVRSGASLKHKIAIRYDAKVIWRDFEVCSLVLKKNHKGSREGKIATNWEGPYRVCAKMEYVAYYLECLDEEKLARTWNFEKLK